jgi:hypothetical protein
MSERISLQQLADEIVDPEYRRTLLKSEDALRALEWTVEDFPSCCGEKVRIQSFIGSAYYAECERCHKFMWDVSGPRFGNSFVTIPDNEKVDCKTEVRWLVGQQRAEAHSDV